MTSNIFDDIRQINSRDDDKLIKHKDEMSVPQYFHLYFWKQMSNIQIKSPQDAQIFIKLALDMRGEMSLPGLGEKLENLPHIKSLYHYWYLLQVLSKCHSHSKEFHEYVVS